MLRTFNMGIGLIVICGPSAADAVLDRLAGAGEPGARRIGEIQDGAGVRYR
jgi:phosphoribosylformylglycinamidine cyclo-ligase